MKALKISILGAGLLSLISCNEFLDRYPYSENSSSTMFSSATLAESVVTGVYSNLLYDYNSTDRSVLNWDSFSSVMDPQEGIVNLDYNYLLGRCSRTIRCSRPIGNVSTRGSTGPMM